MVLANMQRMYEHLLSVGRIQDAEAIDKIYNFSNKPVKKNVLEQIAENKVIENGEEVIKVKPKLPKQKD